MVTGQRAMKRNVNLFSILKEITIAVLTAFAGVLIVADTENGYRLVIIFLSLSLIAAGLKEIVFFISMARHMVGGRFTLYMGVLLMDLGTFTMSMFMLPRFYILLYLAGTYAFSGVVEILEALEVKRNLGPYWKRNLIFGIINILIALICVIFIRNDNTVIYIFAGGLFYSAVTRVIRAFVRSEDVYIEL